MIKTAISTTVGANKNKNATMAKHSETAPAMAASYPSSRVKPSRRLLREPHGHDLRPPEFAACEPVED